MLKRPLEKIVRTPDEFQIPYMMIDGQAVLLHGEPRLTRDIDSTIEAGPEK